MITQTMTSHTALMLVGSAAVSHNAPPPSVKGPIPTIFSPGVTSGLANDGAATFSPDGQSLYFERSYAKRVLIFESRRMNNGQIRKSRPSPARGRTSILPRRPTGAA